MPNPTIKKVSNACNIELDKVEELFVQAEKLAEEQGKSRNYAYIMGIFKKSLGQDCLEKLNWNSSEVKESGILTKIKNLILESDYYDDANYTNDPNQKPVIKGFITSDMRKRICSYIWKKEYGFIQDNIKRNPNLKNDPSVFCNSIEIASVYTFKSATTLHITFASNGPTKTKSFWSKKETVKDNYDNGYFGSHSCYVVCDLKAIKFYQVSMEG